MVLRLLFSPTGLVSTLNSRDGSFFAFLRCLGYRFTKSWNLFFRRELYLFFFLLIFSSLTTQSRLGFSLLESRFGFTGGFPLLQLTRSLPCLYNRLSAGLPVLVFRFRSATSVLGCVPSCCAVREAFRDWLSLVHVSLATTQLS